MREIHKRMDEWVKSGPDGWATPELVECLMSITAALRPKLCVEIGVWGGRSLIPVAMVLKRYACGKIIGIDPWKADASVAGQTKENSEWWRNQKMHDDVYQRFMQNLKTFDVTYVVDVRRACSDEVTIDGPLDYLNIDGNHGEQAYRDIIKWTKLVRVGGIVYCDDVNWSGMNVSKGVEHIKKNGFTELYGIGGGSVLQRTK